MVRELNYHAYVPDARYDIYQERYRDSIRESDKVLVELIRSVVDGRSASLLDIGCSTGNLLRHIKRLLPRLRLTGGDLSKSAIEQCRADPELSGVIFELYDMLYLAPAGQFDVIVANAVTFYLDWPDYREALASVFSALKPGGHYFAFEFLHSFEVQDVAIVETSEWDPDGLKLCFRPIARVKALLTELGYDNIQFNPFELPLDLPFPGHGADVATYTRKDEHGRRMAFRGILYQPWCHMIARKPATSTLDAPTPERLVRSSS
jgi:SAM-dependent methyltransferase